MRNDAELLSLRPRTVGSHSGKSFMSGRHFLTILVALVAMTGAAAVGFASLDNANLAATIRAAGGIDAEARGPRPAPTRPMLNRVYPENGFVSFAGFAPVGMVVEVAAGEVILGRAVADQDGQWTLTEAIAEDEAPRDIVVRDAIVPDLGVRHALIPPSGRPGGTWTVLPVGAVAETDEDAARSPRDAAVAGAGDGSDGTGREAGPEPTTDPLGQLEAWLRDLTGVRGRDDAVEPADAVTPGSPVTTAGGRVVEIPAELLHDDDTARQDNAGVGSGLEVAAAPDGPPGRDGELPVRGDDVSRADAGGVMAGALPVDEPAERSVAGRTAQSDVPNADEATDVRVALGAEAPTDGSASGDEAADAGASVAVAAEAEPVEAAPGDPAVTATRDKLDEPTSDATFDQAARLGRDASDAFSRLLRDLGLLADEDDSETGREGGRDVAALPDASPRQPATAQSDGGGDGVLASGPAPDSEVLSVEQDVAALSPDEASTASVGDAASVSGASGNDGAVQAEADVGSDGAASSGASTVAVTAAVGDERDAEGAERAATATATGDTESRTASAGTNPETQTAAEGETPGHSAAPVASVAADDAPTSTGDPMSGEAAQATVISEAAAQSADDAQTGSQADNVGGGARRGG